MSTAPAVQRRSLPTPVRTERPRPRLRVVPPRQVRPARTPFVLLVLSMLASGLVGLLSLNIALSHDAFAKGTLERQTKLLVEQEQTLRRDLAVQQAPERLARRARELGMVPGSSPTFLDTQSGRVLGGTGSQADN